MGRPPPPPQVETLMDSRSWLLSKPLVFSSNTRARQPGLTSEELAPVFPPLGLFLWGRPGTRWEDSLAMEL